MYNAFFRDASAPPEDEMTNISYVALSQATVLTR
ncbi:MAG TPA: flagellar basal body rod protein, partial [Sulfitobacter sp.]|nr:flagellar basal body rod protein [Sulfitobacter sp.]